MTGEGQISAPVPAGRVIQRIVGQEDIVAVLIRRPQGFSSMGGRKADSFHIIFPERIFIIGHGHDQPVYFKKTAFPGHGAPSVFQNGDAQRFQFFHESVIMSRFQSLLMIAGGVADGPKFCQTGAQPDQIGLGAGVIVGHVPGHGDHVRFGLTDLSDQKLVAAAVAFTVKI